MSTRAVFWKVVAAFALIVLWGEAYGAEPSRYLRIVAPPDVLAGKLSVASIEFGTNVADGERAVYLQSEISLDGGKSWTTCLWEDEVGTSGVRNISFTAPVESAGVAIRVRVAFRGGLAGAVDHTGAAVRWFYTWKHWEEPPACRTDISVHSGRS